MTPGRLILMPNALDLGTELVDLQAVLPLGVIQQAARLRHWAAEDARSARAFLKRVDAIAPLGVALQAIAITELPRPRKGSREPVPANAWHTMLAPALQGEDMGLISEAGLPAVADPGAALVQAAHAAGLTVLPLSGPSSLMMALSASGLNGQSFAFVGYPPQDATARAARLRELESWSRKQGQTQILIETPYRNAALLEGLLAVLQASTWVSVSCGLTLPGGWTRTDTVAAWRKTALQIPDRWPAVFCLLAR